MNFMLANADNIDNACQEVQDAPRIAIDTEFHAERRYYPKLHLVQFCLDNGHTWIIDPHQSDCLNKIGPILLNKPWVLHSGGHDLRILGKALGGFPKHTADTQIGAGLVSTHYPARYTHLLTRYLEEEIPKAATLSDWGRRPLTPQQLAYAAQDVQSLLPLMDAIQVHIKELNREDVFQEACAFELNRCKSPIPAENIWQKIRGHEVLQPIEVAILQELCVWREHKARKEDNPSRSIISDGLLIDLARRKPATHASLLQNRRFPKGIAQRFGEDLLSHIQQASNRPQWGWPKHVQKHTQSANRFLWWKAYAASLADQSRFGKELVLPDSLLIETTLMEDDTAIETLEITFGKWRLDLCGESLQNAIKGQVYTGLKNDRVITKKS